MLRVRVRTGSVCAAVAAALLLAISASTASAFTKAIWGPTYLKNSASLFPIYKQLGVGIYEDAINWATVAPTRPRHAKNPRDPAYHWPAELQQAIHQAKRFHIRVMVQIIFAPPWSNGGRSREWMPNPRDFAAFAIAAARKYPAVHLWMIWGEPNHATNFQPLYPASTSATRLNRQQQIAPHNYARLLDAAYGALKHVNKKNLVIGGSTYTTGDIGTQLWVENLKLPNGRPPRMDMYAHNPFTSHTPSFSGPSDGYYVEFRDLPRLAGLIDKYLHPGLPLFLSEWAVPTCPDQEFSFYLDPEVAARWVSDALRLSRHWKRIYALGYVHLYDIPGESCGGLMTASGQPKPVFQAFARG